MEFYTAREISGLLHLRLGRVYQLIATGQLPGVHLGKRVLCPKAAWEAWANDQLAQALANMKTNAANAKTGSAA